MKSRATDTNEKQSMYYIIEEEGVGHGDEKYKMQGNCMRG